MLCRSSFRGLGSPSLQTNVSSVETVVDDAIHKANEKNKLKFRLDTKLHIYSELWIHSFHAENQITLGPTTRRHLTTVVLVALSSSVITCQALYTG